MIPTVNKFVLFSAAIFTHPLGFCAELVNKNAATDSGSDVCRSGTPRGAHEGTGVPFLVLMRGCAPLNFSVGFFGGGLLRKNILDLLSVYI